MSVDGVLLEKAMENVATKESRRIEKTNEDTPSKRVLPKRKAKSMMARGYVEQLFVLTSPPRKRSRLSTVLQQTKLLPNSKHEMSLKKFGFEDEEAEEDSENSPPRILRPSRISLPLPATKKTPSRISKRRVSYAPDAWKYGKSTTETRSSGISKKVFTGVDKRRPGKVVNENVGESIKCREGLKKPKINQKHTGDGAGCGGEDVPEGGSDITPALRKPILLLKRIDPFCGARFISLEIPGGSDISRPGSSIGELDGDEFFDGVPKGGLEEGSDSSLSGLKTTKIKQKHTGRLDGARCGGEDIPEGGSDNTPALRKPILLLKRIDPFCGARFTSQEIPGGSDISRSGSSIGELDGDEFFDDIPKGGLEEGSDPSLLKKAKVKRKRIGQLGGARFTNQEISEGGSNISRPGSSIDTLYGTRLFDGDPEGGLERGLDVSLSGLKKPKIKLKRIDALDGTRVTDEYSDNSDQSSDEGNDFEFSGTPESSDESDSGSETPSSCGSEKKRKAKRRTQSVSKRKTKQLIEEKKTNNKYTTCGIISNVFPKLKFSTQRVETLEEVYRRLHTSEIPERLPCREAEFERICTFIKECVSKDAVSQAMYISGVPGTGKTATALQAVRHLKASKNFSKFNFAIVNAMEMADPKQTFVEIYQQLFRQEKKIAPKTARKKLNDMFRYRDRKRLPTVLLVDELDLLNTKKQEIIYDIFNWSANEESLVSVLAIANTLDLPERLLSQRISSRLGANRLCFQPYDHEEVAYIIRDRLRGSTAVEAEAIELASRKVAAVSGDVRKALDILRSAAQIAIIAKQKQLTMKNVQEAIRQASTNVRVELIRALPLHSVLLLRAAVAEQMSSGLDEFQFLILFKQYRLQCRVANVDPISTSAAYRNAMEMCSARLLVAAPGTGSLSRRFRLGMTAHDIQFAFKQVDESVF